MDEDEEEVEAVEEVGDEVVGEGADGGEEEEEEQVEAEVVLDGLEEEGSPILE